MSTDTWLTTTLGEVAEFGNGGAWNQNEYTAEGIRVVRVSDVRGDTLDLSECKYLSTAALNRYGRHQLRAGDLIVCTVGSHPTQPASVVGRAVVVPKFADGALLNQNAVCIRPSVPHVDSGWLGFLGRSRRFHDYIIGCAGGAASQVRMPIGLLKQMPITVPPLPTQRRIASILSAYDNLIENNTRRIAILEEMARRIYEEWFVRFHFPGREGVRMVESEWGLVPDRWELTSLGAVAENHDRFRRPLSKMEREDFRGPYPYYGAAKVFDYVREYLFDGQFLLLAEDGSVETPDGYPVLQLTDGKFWANNHTHILRGTRRASTEFLYLRLERQPIRGYITGAAQPKLTQAAINRIPIVLPPSGVLDQFDAHVRPLFQLRATLTRAIANLRATRDLLLPKLISGELDMSAMPEPEALTA